MLTTKRLTADLILVPDLGWLVVSESLMLDPIGTIVAREIEDEFGPDEPETAKDITPERMAELLAAGGVRLVTNVDGVLSKLWWTGKASEGEALPTFTLVSD